MDDFNAKIVKQIRNAMEENGVSVNTLANKTAMSQSTLNRALNGETELTLNRLYSICFHLDLNIVHIIKTANRY